MDIAESRLSEFPDWLEPSVVIGDIDEGEIYFATNSPYDFDILFRQKPLIVPPKGVKMLIFPLNASAPVHAVVLVHGRSGIKPGREAWEGQTLADASIAAFVTDYYRPGGLTSESDYMAKLLAVTAASELAKPALAGYPSSLEVSNGPA